jgi:hypothetical protein
MIIKRWVYVIIYVGLFWAAWPLWAAEEPAEPADAAIKLTRAVMCESIEGYEPAHTAVTFSIDVGKISCYTSFEGINKPTHTYHKWYRRDALVTAKRLTLKPPSWSTYSSIQLRESDKGPWRVEIYDARNQWLETLRFSVTD